MSPLELLDQEVATLVAEAVVKFGVAAQVRTAGGRLYLEGAGREASLDLAGTRVNWDTLPFDAKRRTAQELARALVNAWRDPDARVSSSASGGVPLGWLGAVAAVVVLGAAGWLALRWPFAPKPVATVESNVDRELREREERARRACDAGRARVMQGATLGGTDVEGWVVEVLGFRRSPGTPALQNPKLAQFVEGAAPGRPGRFVWKQAPHLVGLEGFGTGVEVAPFDLVGPAARPDAGSMRPEAGSPSPGATETWPGVKLTFTGRYVPPYFRDDERGDYFKASAAVLAALGFDHGGLYARCAHSPHPHLGSWFVGHDPAGAAAALVFVMGLHADVPHVRAELRLAGGAPAPRQAWDGIVAATASLDRARVAGVMGTHGAAVSGKAGDQHLLSFPFRDGSRASRASRALAEAVGLP